MGDHIIDGEFQSDKYPTCPRGKVPLSIKAAATEELTRLRGERDEVVRIATTYQQDAAIRDASEPAVSPRKEQA